MNKLKVYILMHWNSVISYNKCTLQEEFRRNDYRDFIGW